MQFFQPHAFFAQRHVAVHFIHVVVDRFDQAVIDLHGHLRLVQRGFQRGVVMPCVGKELQLAELGVQHGRRGIAPAVQGGIESVKRIFAEHPVRAAQISNQAFLGQGTRRSAGVLNRREMQVRVAEHRPDGAGRFRDLASGGQQGFFRGRQGMRFLPADLFDGTAVGLQRRLLGEKAFQDLIGNGQDLRRGVGSGTLHSHSQGHGLVAHILVEAVSGVFITLSGSVVAQHMQPVAGPVIFLEIAEQIPGAAAQRAFHRRGLRRQRFQCFIFFGPGLIRGKHIFCRPGILFFYFTSFQNAVVSHGVPPDDDGWYQHTTDRSVMQTKHPLVKRTGVRYNRT